MRLAVAVGGDEDRVVAEAALAARRLGHAALAGALDACAARCPARRRRPRRRSAARSRAATSARSLSRFSASVARLAGVAGGAHAGAAAERLGLDAGVVGDRGRAGGGGGGARLDQRVLRERLAGLGRQLDLVGQRLELRVGQQALELAQLVGVAGREDEPAMAVRLPPVAAACTARRPSMPVLGEREQLVEVGARERRALGGRLDLDEAAVAGHDDVGVDLGARVLRVVEVEQRHRRRRCRRRPRRPCR